MGGSAQPLAPGYESVILALFFSLLVSTGPPAFASAVQDATEMGVRIVVWEGEPIGVAFRRFKKKLEQHNVPWEMRRRAHFVDGTALRRAKEFQKWFKSRCATTAARREGRQPG